MLFTYYMTDNILLMHSKISSNTGRFSSTFKDWQGQTWL